MLTGAVALGFTLLASSLQAENEGPLKWVIKKGDQFKLDWTYEHEERTQIGARGKVPVFLKEKREVEAILTCAQDMPQWRLDMVLTDVKWFYGTGEYQITALKREGKEPDAKVRLLVRDTKDRPGLTLEVFEVAQKRAEDMKAVLKATYAFALLKGETGVIYTNGRTGRGIYSLFEHSFTHTRWPTEGTPKVGTKWAESTKGLSPGIPYLETMEMKFYSNTEKKGAVVKGTGKEKISKQLLPGRTFKAEFNVDREFAFHPEGYLMASKEVKKYTKEVVAREAQFREKVSNETEQTLKITRHEEKKKGSTRGR